MKYSMRLLALFGFALAVCGCSSEKTSTLTITGASTMAPLVAEIGKRFEKMHSGVRIDVQTGGSSRGILDATNCYADIGMSSRPLAPSESPGMQTHVLARDGVAFIVHSSNPVQSLTNTQLADIYQGKIQNWRAVGGKPAAITVVNRADGRSELDLLTHLFRIKQSDIKADLVAGETQHAVKLAAGNPNAIVYLSLGSAEYEARHGTPIKLLPFDGVEATVKNVGSGKYTFSRPLLFVTQQPPAPLAKTFLEYALSEEVHDLVREFAFVPVK